jgi:hypothetical protein
MRRAFGEVIEHWLVNRATRMPSELIFWNPKPTTWRQRIRQSWCFLTHHRMIAFVQDDGDGHQSAVEECLRCGISLSSCLSCSTSEVDE